MWRYLGRTILERLLLLVLISIVSHAVVHLAPGSPTDVDAMNPMMKAEDVLKIRKSFHLDEPLHVQYGYWLRDLFTGELRSFRDNQPVLPRIWDRFLNSLPLFATTTPSTSPMMYASEGAPNGVSTSRSYSTLRPCIS